MLWVEVDLVVVGIVIMGVGWGFCFGFDVEVLKQIMVFGVFWGLGVDDGEVFGLFIYLLVVGKLVIVVVNGFVVGGGFVLVVMSDVCFVLMVGFFMTVFFKRGFIAEHGTSWILFCFFGVGWVFDLLWSFCKVDVDEVVRIGLVEDVVLFEDLFVWVRCYVVELAVVVAFGSLRDTKRLVYVYLGFGYFEVLRDVDWV